ncbi:Na+/H+ antiporter NhaC family protein [Halioglobus sp. HI00S01]|uniref:Na+/H+ antiporter NhaC family protein n=1 Tax=Halioglobus sp. HI00S01 TaxID=1822214 RepID=UPI000B216BC1|nr:Na+/H+ antiporter NhaC family protein [Halioglobus sp. HI00S01]
MSDNSRPEKSPGVEPFTRIGEAGTGTLEQPDLSPEQAAMLDPLLKPSLWLIVVGLICALYVHFNIDSHWLEQKTVYQVEQGAEGQLVYSHRGKQIELPNVVPYERSPLRQEALDVPGAQPTLGQQWVVEFADDGTPTYSTLSATRHFGFWSLLPALVAVSLCLLTREPLTALLGGIIVGAFLLGRFDITDEVLIPNLATDSAAGVLMLYLWLLGGLMGIWSRTGAAQAFATFMTQHFVRGPRSAKLVAWLLGALFFQGGTMSTVLVGSTVKPLADQNKVSHEELAYIVDSTASPIASILAFNAWPAYVQALIFVPGVAFLATEADRIAFFFSSIPFSFYGILAVTGTLLLSLDIDRFAGKGLREARKRARETGALDAPGASPLSARELQESRVPAGYSPHVLEFLVPLIVLISIAIGSFIVGGTPKVNWAFGAALMVSAFSALFRGMSLGNLIEGFGDGLKGVVVASVILMLAITVGAISKEVGAGQYMVDLLGQSIPFWALPVILQLLTMVTAFSTGTSWGTYAITFPLAMPLAWVIAQQPGIENPMLYMSICFAAVLNGSVYGDHCSPISDTTILSSMTTGCDLMDHVKTQIAPATLAAASAGVLWTLSALFLA